MERNEADLPLSGVTVVSLEQAIAAPLAKPASCGLGRAGHQDRAAGRRRFLPRLRSRDERDVEPVRLDQQVEGEPRHRPQKSGRPEGARRLAAAGRRLHSEPGARRGGAAGPRCRIARAEISPDHRLRRFGLWCGRTLQQQEGLRSPGPVRGRRPRHQRHRGGACEGRTFGGRHRHRHVHPQRRADGAVSPRADRPRAPPSRPRCSIPSRTG
ncbi:hypothetical protein ACVWWR_001811 [Bradyrhizobium sp. LM3.2]